MISLFENNSSKKAPRTNISPSPYYRNFTVIIFLLPSPLVFLGPVLVLQASPSLPCPFLFSLCIQGASFEFMLSLRLPAFPKLHKKHSAYKLRPNCDVNPFSISYDSFVCIGKFSLDRTLLHIGLPNKKAKHVQTKSKI